MRMWHRDVFLEMGVVAREDAAHPVSAGVEAPATRLELPVMMRQESVVKVSIGKQLVGEPHILWVTWESSPRIPVTLPVTVDVFSLSICSRPGRLSGSQLFR